MVRVGDWELRLVRSGTGEPFPEVQQQSGAGTTYAVAAPGQAFEVQVTHHTNPFTAMFQGIGGMYSVRRRCSYPVAVAVFADACSSLYPSQRLHAVPPLRER